MENIITLKGICKTYGKGDGLVTALRPIDLEIKKGEMLAIMGKSGSGKSTLLNLLAGLDTPDSGEFIYNGSPINTKNQNKMAKFRFSAFRINLPVLTFSFGMILLIAFLFSVFAINKSFRGSARDLKRG